MNNLKLLTLAAAIFLALSAHAQNSANAPITIKQTGKKTYSGGLTLTKYNFFLPAYDDTVRSLFRPESECTIWYPSDESKVAHAIASYLGTMILCDGMTPSRISHFKQAFIDLLDCYYDANEGRATTFRPIYANKSIITMEYNREVSSAHHMHYRKDAATFLLSTGKKLTPDMLPPFCKLMKYIRQGLRRYFNTDKDSDYNEYFDLNCSDNYSIVYVDRGNLCLLYPSPTPVSNIVGQPLIKIPYKKIAHLLSPQVKAYFK